METPKLLIAGSSQRTVNLSRTAVEQLGYQIVTAPAMSVALFLAQKNLPEIIISDLHMLDGDGMTFLHEVQMDEELSEIPFIFCVDQLPGETAELQALKAGALKMVPNSLNAEEFLELIHPLILARIAAKGKRQEQTPE